MKQGALVLAGGTVVDGMGGPAVLADLLIEDGRVAQIGHFEAPGDVPRLDCAGLVVAAGFIDVHSHSDLQVLEDRPEKVRQGVTAEVVGRALAHPLSLIGSDGFYSTGRPHPRLFGTFPRFLGAYVREAGLVSLPEAVRKITSAAALRLGVRDRGGIASGLIGDLVVFDAALIGSEATYTEPAIPPTGIKAVLRAGEVVWSSPV